VISLRVAPRVVLPVLLMFSLVPLFLVPDVHSQNFSFRTVTSTLTSVQTTTIHSTSYSVSSVGSLQFGTHGSWSSTQSGGQSYFMNILSYGGTACAVSWLSFQSQKGLRISFALSADDSIDFFIIAGNNWRGGACDYSSSQFVLKADQVTAYSLNWTSPDDQPYYFLFLYRGHGINNGVVLSSFQASNPASTKQTQTFVIQTTAYLTGFQTYIQTQTIEVPFLEANASWLLAVALLAIVIALFLVTRRRAGKAPKRH
jgi:hypothetical protein